MIAELKTQKKIVVLGGLIGNFETNISTLNDIDNTNFTFKDLASILSNPNVEQNNGLYGTVYANIACPAIDEFYYACDDFPAASKSQWKLVDWNW